MNQPDEELSQLRTQQEGLTRRLALANRQLEELRGPSHRRGGKWRRLRRRARRLLFGYYSPSW